MDRNRKPDSVDWRAIGDPGCQIRVSIGKDQPRFEAV